MAYMNYSRAMYRTGFRPYGQTNAWAASQLNGMDTGEAVLSGYLGQSHPFTEHGGWDLRGLGQNKPFAPWVLHGVPVCLDQSENPIACQNPDCTYGDCGATSTGRLPSGSCLDQSENQVMCADPNCTFGDCLPPATKPGVVNLPPGPSPRVGVAVAPPFVGSTWATSTIIKGVPDLLLYGFAALAAFSFIAPAGGRRR